MSTRITSRSPTRGPLWHNDTRKLATFENAAALSGFRPRETALGVIQSMQTVIRQYNSRHLAEPKTPPAHSYGFLTSRDGRGEMYCSADTLIVD